MSSLTAKARGAAEDALNKKVTMEAEARRLSAEAQRLSEEANTKKLAMESQLAASKARLDEAKREVDAIFEARGLPPSLAELDLPPLPEGLATWSLDGVKLPTEVQLPTGGVALPDTLFGLKRDQYLLAGGGLALGLYGIGAYALTGAGQGDDAPRNDAPPQPSGDALSAPGEATPPSPPPFWATLLLGDSMPASGETPPPTWASLREAEREAKSGSGTVPPSGTAPPSGMAPPSGTPQGVGPSPAESTLLAQEAELRKQIAQAEAALNAAKAQEAQEAAEPMAPSQPMAPPTSQPMAPPAAQPMGQAAPRRLSSLKDVDTRVWSQAAQALDAIATDAYQLGAMATACDSGDSVACELLGKEAAKREWLAKVVDAPTWGRAASAAAQVASLADACRAGDAAACDMLEDSDAKAAWLDKLDAPIWGLAAAEMSAILSEASNMRGGVQDAASWSGSSKLDVRSWGSASAAVSKVAAEMNAPTPPPQQRWASQAEYEAGRVVATRDGSTRDPEPSVQRPAAPNAAPDGAPEAAASALSAEEEARRAWLAKLDSK